MSDLKLVKISKCFMSVYYYHNEVLIVCVRMTCRFYVFRLQPAGSSSWWSRFTSSQSVWLLNEEEYKLFHSSNKHRFDLEYLFSQSLTHTHARLIQYALFWKNAASVLYKFASVIFSQLHKEKTREKERKNSLISSDVSCILMSDDCISS